MQQTNTSDMLDLAVEYVKELQSQVKVCFNLENLLLHSLIKNIIVSSRHYRTNARNVLVRTSKSSSSNESIAEYCLKKGNEIISSLVFSLCIAMGRKYQQKKTNKRDNNRGKAKFSFALKN